MNTIDIDFKNLPIGYYFIFEDKIYLKVNDFGASQLFSNQGLEFFTDRDSHLTSVGCDLTYKRPSFTLVKFNPRDNVKFVKYRDIRQYSFNEYMKSRPEKNFSEIKIGESFLDQNENKYYIKISYYNAKPFYDIKIGLTDSQSISLSSISSGLCTSNPYNALYYNGSLLLRYKINAWNIIWFNKTYTEYTYNSFDTENNYYEDSNKLLNFIKSIPNESFVIILNSNNTQISSNILDSNDQPKHIKRIFSDYKSAQLLFESVGIEKTMIDNLGKSDSFMVMSIKNKNKIKYQKISPLNGDKPYLDPTDTKYNIIDFIYDVPLNNKFYQLGNSKSYDLDYKVNPVTNLEVYARVVYNLSDLDPRILSDTDIYDYM